MMLRPNKVNPPQLDHLPTRAAIHIATAYYWCESGTQTLPCIPVRGLRKEWISISHTPPPEGNCLGVAHAFSLCSALMLTVISTQSLGSYPLSCYSSPAEDYLSTHSWLSFEREEDGAGSTLRHTTTLWSSLESPLEDL